jgi:rubrerythrin
MTPEIKRTITTPRRRSRHERRLHVVPRPEPRPEPMHRDERRLRDAGGPHDRACYSCQCGYYFEADVSTSVSCPHCGAAQAW